MQNSFARLLTLLMAFGLSVDSSLITAARPRKFHTMTFTDQALMPREAAFRNPGPALEWVWTSAGQLLLGDSEKPVSFGAAPADDQRLDQELASAVRAYRKWINSADPDLEPVANALYWRVGPEGFYLIENDVETTKTFRRGMTRRRIRRGLAGEKEIVLVTVPEDAALLLPAGTDDKPLYIGTPPLEFCRGFIIHGQGRDGVDRIGVWHSLNFVNSEASISILRSIIRDLKPETVEIAVFSLDIDKLGHDPLAMQRALSVKAVTYFGRRGDHALSLIVGSKAIGWHILPDDPTGAGRRLGYVAWENLQTSVILFPLRSVEKYEPRRKIQTYSIGELMLTLWNGDLNEVSTDGYLFACLTDGNTQLQDWISLIPSLGFGGPVSWRKGRKRAVDLDIGQVATIPTPVGKILIAAYDNDYGSLVELPVALSNALRGAVRNGIGRLAMPLFGREAAESALFAAENLFNVLADLAKQRINLPHLTIAIPDNQEFRMATRLAKSYA